MLRESQELAEREGFEPSKGYKPLLVFKTSAFNRSATSPVSGFAPRIVLGLTLVFNRDANGNDSVRSDCNMRLPHTPLLEKF